MLEGIYPEYLFIAAGSFAATAALLYLWLHTSAGERLLAIPNHRSSHVNPTPTGGGAVIVLVLCAVLLGYALLGVAWAGWLALGGVIIAAIGFADDLWDLSARVRLLVQVLVVTGLLYSAGHVPALQAQGSGFGLWPVVLLWVFLVLALVWFINLFNFMDGIDGIATAQSASFCLGALLFIAGDPGWLTGVLWAGFAASLGFAVFNAAPARIFMGDVGSAFWGLMLGILALHLAVGGFLPLVASLVLLSAFWFDASYTLCVRIVTGQNFVEGHRSHLYQRLADRFGHGRTTALYVLLFVVWQWPLVWWCRSHYVANILVADTQTPWWPVLLACLPLLLGCVLLRAGQQDRDEQDSNGQK